MTQSRIFIGSDPLMTKDSEQTSNNRWLFDILKRPVSRATGTIPEIFFADAFTPGVLDRKEFFALSNIRLDATATQFWFDEGLINAASVKYLSGFLSKGDIFIGYELSEQTRSIFTSLGVNYVDLWLHPVRFLDDVLFAFNSNVPAVHDKLFSYHLNDDQIFLHADRIKIQTYKGWRRVEADIEDNSALFVGQMMNDKSVCHQGRMLNLLDYKGRMEEIASQHARVYYARHPYMKSGDAEILKFVNQHPKMQLTTTPTYRLITSPKLRTVTGVSSSVITEAKYFDKATEILFKPILDIGHSEVDESYASIYQDFVSPHFWSDVLSPITKTYPAPELKFENGKDKIRDMLGFYWAYRDVDKIENMRHEVIGMRSKLAGQIKDKKKSVVATPLTQTLDGYFQTQSQIAEIEGRFEGHDVVSFDIFDTLIERIIDKPSDVHAMMQTSVLQITDGKIQDFPKARREARDQALHKANGEEVLLRDRYQAMAAAYGLTSQQGEELFQLELAFERKICKPRYVGQYLLEQALRQKKRVILVTDIFFDRAFVEELLAQCGITRWNRLYLSSEEGVLKQTGRLFDVVLLKEGVMPEKVLHIGDNKIADIEKGREKGLAVAHVTDKRMIADALGSAYKAYNQISDPHTKSLVRGLTSREITSSALPMRPGSFGASAESLGYTIAGPFMWGFAKWILKQATTYGANDIYFLARDGEIVKKCYDILAASQEGAPTSHYVLASRRAVNVARLKNVEDIIQMLQTSFTPCSLGKLLESRFGIDPASIKVRSYQVNGYESHEDIADFKVDKSKLERFFSDEDVAQTILKNARQEAHLLSVEYNKVGLNKDANRPVLVDIGHSGSLQAAISDIMGIPETLGLYFATKDDIDEKIGRKHQAKGYAVDRMTPAQKSHPYQKHILMFELLFQNNKGSFVCFEQKDHISPIYLDLSGEAARVSFIEEVHGGIERFCSDISNAEDTLGLTLDMRGSEAISAYVAILDKPYQDDAEVFQGIGFENKYNARDMQWIVPIGPSDKNSALWRQGALALYPEETNYEMRSFGPAIKIVRLFTLNARKRAKLDVNPDAFFADSQKAIVRAIGQVC